MFSNTGSHSGTTQPARARSWPKGLLQRKRHGSVTGGVGSCHHFAWLRPGFPAWFSPLGALLVASGLLLNVQAPSLAGILGDGPISV